MSKMPVTTVKELKDYLDGYTDDCPIDPLMLQFVNTNGGKILIREAEKTRNLKEFDNPFMRSCKLPVGD